MTEPAPTPACRRFPYVQLVFCIACLTMTVWTWMRYSYVWDMSPEDLYDWLASRSALGVPSPYVRFHCKDTEGRVWPHLGLFDGPENITEARLVPASADSRQVSGRLRILHRGDGIHVAAMVDMTASRFHPASIGGLVVGAMGCFIFGLYLRRWLVDRKALASQPGQDMIA